jgi:hypothetical protein
MRNESWCEDDVDRAMTANLVGDENIAALGIFGHWQHDRVFRPQEAAAIT